MWLYQLLYIVFGAAAVLGGVSVVAQRNPVNSAISLLFTFLCVAALYIMHGAPFLAMIQIIVYAGAILILVVFTIMLLSLREPGEGLLKLWTYPQKIAALAVCSLLGGQLLYLAYRALAAVAGPTNADLQELATPAALGRALFDKYLLPFEAASVLLLAAILGAVALTRRLPGASAAIDAEGPDEPAAPEGRPE